jgi:hypothetical protein
LEFSLSLNFKIFIFSGLSSKVLFFGKRPYSELMQFTQYADIGLALDKPKSLNYKYALPNKLFDYINTQTAVVSSNLIEIEILG